MIPSNRPSLNEAQKGFLERLTKRFPHGGSFFCDEGMYPSNSWMVKLGDFSLSYEMWQQIFSMDLSEHPNRIGDIMGTDGEILFIAYPEFKDLVDKGMLLLGNEGWQSAFGDGQRRKSFEFSVSGQAYDYSKDEPKGSKPMPNSKYVFVVHGQNEAARDAMFTFLRSIGLNPLEWGQMRALTGETSPYIGDIIEAGFSYAQAFVVLLTGDDEAKLRDQFITAKSPEMDKNLTPQARPNVLFEAGMAMGRHPKRTILVELGHLRPFSDIAGRHVVRLNDTPAIRTELVQRLRTAQCDLDDTGSDWLSKPSFDKTV